MLSLSPTRMMVKCSMSGWTSTELLNPLDLIYWKSSSNLCRAGSTWLAIWSRWLVWGSPPGFWRTSSSSWSCLTPFLWLSGRFGSGSASLCTSFRVRPSPFRIRRLSPFLPCRNLLSIHPAFFSLFDECCLISPLFWSADEHSPAFSRNRDTIRGGLGGPRSGSAILAGSRQGKDTFHISNSTTHACSRGSHKGANCSFYWLPRADGLEETTLLTSSGQ